MTDEEIKEIAKKTMKEKYCNKYNSGHTDDSYLCEDNRCPLYNEIDGYYDHCIGLYYDTAFIDGYKAAFDVLIEKIKSL